MIFDCALCFTFVLCFTYLYYECVLHICVMFCIVVAIHRHLDLSFLMKNSQRDLFSKGSGIAIFWSRCVEKAPQRRNQ